MTPTSDQPPPTPKPKLVRTPKRMSCADKSRTDEALAIIAEHADDLRERVRKLRQRSLH